MYDTQENKRLQTSMKQYIALVAVLTTILEISVVQSVCVQVCCCRTWYSAAI